MAIAEQRLGIIAHGIGQAVDIASRTGLAFEAEKLGKKPIGRILLRCTHGMPSNCAVPLIPASKPLASAGNVAINSRGGRPSAIRAPRRVTAAGKGWPVSSGTKVKVGPGLSVASQREGTS